MKVYISSNIDMDSLVLLLKCIFFFCFGNTVAANSGVKSSDSIVNPSFSNFRITEDALQIAQVDTDIECTNVCLTKKGCLSVSYHPRKHACVLFNKDFVNVNSVLKIEENGWQYAYVIKAEEKKREACIGKTTSTICSFFCLWYISKPILTTHTELATICTSFDGGDLVKIDRQLKQHCVIQILGDEINGEVFIQGTKDESVNKWFYNDGTEMPYYNWNTGGGQPNNKTNEIYIGLRKSKGYVWHDMFEADVNAAVCQQT